MVTYTRDYIERCVRQHHAHTRKFSGSGDKLFSIGHGLFDLFVGQKGWREPIRFRLVHLRQTNTHQIIQVFGPVLSREYRTFLLKELVRS